MRLECASQCPRTASRDDVPAGRAGLEPRPVRAPPHAMDRGTRSSFPSPRCRSRPRTTTPALPAVPVVATLECSGTDVLALCLAAILACPVPWRARFAGIAGAVAFVLALNTVRIATLGHAAASPGSLRRPPSPGLAGDPRPGRRGLRLGLDADRPPRRGTAGRRSRWRAGPAGAAVRAAGGGASRRLCPRPARGSRGARPWSRPARGRPAAAAVAPHHRRSSPRMATGNVLATSRGAFIVTPECLATALVPLYVAGLLAAPLRLAGGAPWPWSPAPPLFAALAIVAVAPARSSARARRFAPLPRPRLPSARAGRDRRGAARAGGREPPAPRRWARAATRTAAALGAAAILAVARRRRPHERGARRRARHCDLWPRARPWI